MHDCSSRCRLPSLCTARIITVCKHCKSVLFQLIIISPHKPGNTFQIPAQSFQVVPVWLLGRWHITCQLFARMCNIRRIKGQTTPTHHQAPVATHFCCIQCLAVTCVTFHTRSCYCLSFLQTQLLQQNLNMPWISLNGGITKTRHEPICWESWHPARHLLHRQACHQTWFHTEPKIFA